MNRWIYFFSFTVLMLIGMIYYKIFVIELGGVYFLLSLVLTILILIGTVVSSISLYARLVDLISESGWNESEKWYKWIGATILNGCVMAMMLVGYPFIYFREFIGCKKFI